MKNVLLVSLLAALVPLAAQADDGWSGSGEMGFAATRGNTKSETLNARLQLKKEDEVWKHSFFLNALRNKGESSATVVENGVPVSVTRYDLTANRYEAGASSGYKLDERSYIIGAARYERDEFSPYNYQGVVSLGYGYTAIKNTNTELAFEVGPGYRRLDKRAYTEMVGQPPVLTSINPGAEGSVVGRGLIAFKHNFSETTAFENIFLVEAGSGNTFMQNDAGLAVSMNSKLALKVGYQVRRNSDVSPGTDKTDQMVTTNLVYKF